MPCITQLDRAIRNECKDIVFATNRLTAVVDPRICRYELGEDQGDFKGGCPAIHRALVVLEQTGHQLSAIQPRCFIIKFVGTWGMFWADLEELLEAIGTLAVKGLPEKAVAIATEKARSESARKKNRIFRRAMRKVIRLGFFMATELCTQCSPAKANPHLAYTCLLEQHYHLFRLAQCAIHGEREWFVDNKKVFKAIGDLGYETGENQVRIVIISRI